MQVATSVRWALCVSACLLAGGVHAQSFVYQFGSEAGDYIGQGKSATLNEGNASVRLMGDRSNVSVIIEGVNEWHRIAFAAPVEEQLAPSTYPSAERSPFQTGRSAGMSVSQNGRACNDIWGAFAIRQIEFDASGQVQKLEATFLQQCEQNTAPKLTGRLSINTKPMLLNLSSEVGDYVGQGVRKDYFNDTSRFALSGKDRYLSYAASGQRDDWRALLGAPTGTLFEAGKTYTTTGSASANTAGFDFFGNGRGCNAPQGSLTVHRIARDTQGEVKGLHADFVQRCDNSSGVLRGTIRMGV